VPEQPDREQNIPPIKVIIITCAHFLKDKWQNRTLKTFPNKLAFSPKEMAHCEKLVVKS